MIQTKKKRMEESQIIKKNLRNGVEFSSTSQTISEIRLTE